MPNILERYGDIAILVVLFLEDLGVPMPIPADVALLYAGLRLREHKSPVTLVIMMFLAINCGATILYFVIRSGGRPLVDRFGRYVHLDQPKLEKAEAWLNRGGMTGIMLGRALPGVRIVTVIACGLFKVPVRRYLIAQFLGVAGYMAVLLGAGYFLGPQAVESVRLPAISLRLVVMVIGVVAFPLVLRRLNRQTAEDDTRTIQAGLTSGERITADLLAGFGGMFELATVWAITLSVAGITQRDEIRRAVFRLARWLNRTDSPWFAYAVNYLALMTLCLLASVVFFQVLMPRLRIGPRRLGRQTLALWTLTLIIFTVMIVINLVNHYIRRPNDISVWLSHSGPIVLATIVVGLLGYAYVAAQVRRLAIDRFSEDPEVAPSANDALRVFTNPPADTEVAPASQPTADAGPHTVSSS